MIETDEAMYLVAARAGDEVAFQHLTDPHRRELLVHCYRMLGSLDDAEDVLQETLWRAWRRLDSFERRAPLRAWLYKIATHAALDALDGRRARSLPMVTHAPVDPRDPLPDPSSESLWLTPLPDALLPVTTVSPEALYDERESVGLAFLAALQHLPGRQRAVLILRDVLGWRASEVAELLEMTVVSANSALQRARATMKMQRSAFAAGTIAPPIDERMSTLLDGYVQAWEAADTTRLVALLREDAALAMPPVPAWYSGRAAIEAFFATILFAGDGRGRFRLTATRANGCPAFAMYVRDAAGVYQPSALQVLVIAHDQIAEIHSFLALDDRLFARFGLPASIDR